MFASTPGGKVFSTTQPNEAGFHPNRYFRRPVTD